MNFKITFKKPPNLRSVFLIAIVCFFSIAMTKAQTITGNVKAEGQPLPGASVSIKGTSKGVITDFDGKYTISADASATLVFSYVGFANKEVLVGNQKTINVSLDADNKLDEIVVIGYGTQRKSDLTGAVSTVSAKDVAELPVSRVDQALQGRAAGVQITQTSGAPGSGTSIRVRGGNSITGSNQPLWVIDGIIVGTNFNLNNLNANDVKSIEILKDASSIAIYGSRGANGVILVTTKKGTNVGGGKPQVSVGMYSSMQLVPETPDYLTQAQQIEYTNQDAILRGVTAPFPGNPSDYPNNDFFNRLLSPSTINNIDVSVSGSSENGSVSYYNSLNFFDQDGLIENSGIQKYIFRSNLDFKLSENLKAGIRINYSRIKQENGVVGYSGLLGILPTQPIYNADGSFNGANEVTGNPFNNPVATAQLDIDETIASNLLSTLYLEYNPIENLTLRSTFNPNITNSKRNEFTSSQRPDLQTGDSNARIRTVSSISWNNENTIQYSGDIGEDHSYTVLGGASFQKDVAETASAQAFGFTTDATTFNSIRTGTDSSRNLVDSGYSQRTLVSFFGRLNY
ncbi:MAG: SusC/RagA family TonB-linked outer membrane protein, partial [Polaribacter sp.]